MRSAKGETFTLMIKRLSLAAGLLLAAISCAWPQAGQYPSGFIQGNAGASKGQGVPTAISAMLDRAFGSTRGSILERGASGWTIAAPSATAGLPWASGGTGADPSYGVLGIVGGGTGGNTGATARSSLGLAIGTNVEAWDNDLDCLAALSTTGVIHRTGAGTCSAGTVAFADLVTGTQDTVIGYFGSTTASAATLPNCTAGSLNYAIATHLFSCNATAGTGNVSNTGTPTSGQFALWTSSTVIQGVSPASKSDQQTGSSTTAAVTPSQQQQHDSAIKAHIYVTQSAGTYTTQESYNMSASKTGTGALTLTFATPFASSVYSLVCGISELTTVGPSTVIVNSSSATLNLRNFAGAATDAAFSCHALGRQ